MKLCAAILFLSAMLADGAQYFIDYVGGSDANAGTSAGAAWQHISNDNGNVVTGLAASTAIHAGDYLFLKGGVVYSNAQVTCATGNLMATGTAASISAAGVLTDATVNFTTSNVLAGDLLYVFNNLTNGSGIESCGWWSIANVTATTLTVSNFIAYTNPMGSVITPQADAASELSYLVCRPVHYASLAGFGTGLPIIDGSLTNYGGFFTPANWTQFTGLQMQNSNQGTNGALAGTTNVAFGFIDNRGSTLKGCFIDGCTITNGSTAVYMRLSGPEYICAKNCMFGTLVSFGYIGGEWSMFQNNTVTNAVGGMRNAGEFSLVRDNAVMFMSTIYGSHGDGMGPIFPGSDGLPNQYGWIYRNLIRSATQAINFTGSSAGPTYAWTVANNLIVGQFANDGSGPGGVCIYMECCPGMRLLNNVTVGTNGATGWGEFLNLGQRDTTAGTGIGSWSTNVLVQGNISFNGGTYTQCTAISAYNTAITNGLVCKGNNYWNPNTVDANQFATNGVNCTWAAWNGAGLDNDGISTTNTNPNFTQPSGYEPSSFNLHNTLTPVYGIPVSISDFGGTVGTANQPVWGLYFPSQAGPTRCCH